MFDIYLEDSLKRLTRISRGQSDTLRKRLMPQTLVPRGIDWPRFLAQDKNKEELFTFLAEQLINDTSVQLTPGTSCVVASIEMAIPRGSVSDLDQISPCNQEEADQRIFLHLLHMANQGHSIAGLRTNDTDLVTSAVGLYDKLGLQELYVDFGTSEHRRVYLFLLKQFKPCRCKVRCTGRCACVKEGRSCTPLCLCYGQCDRD